MDNAEHDRTIIDAFEREIADWPPDQAVAALKIVRAVVAGEVDATKALDVEHGPLGELTVLQFERVEIVLRKIFGDWTH
jgi:hypothetical protein